ncbi:hypothetical protein [Nocardia sp. SC052]|uniref:hypothetical protein n=1 Tax=Nocardia sichangensis TaxID=3385975 RepID=UPI0039A1A1EC
MPAELVRRACPKPSAQQPEPLIIGEYRTRPIVTARSGGLCERCGARAHSVHHRRNAGQGGPWTPQNCVHLCGDGTRLCHGWITTHPDNAHSEGYALKHGDNPALIPITHWLYGAVRLDDTGGYVLAA